MVWTPCGSRTIGYVLHIVEHLLLLHSDNTKEVAKFQNVRIKRRVNAFLLCLVSDAAFVGRLYLQHCKIKEYFLIIQKIFQKILQSRMIPFYHDHSWASAAAKLSIKYQITIVHVVHFHLTLFKRYWKSDIVYVEYRERIRVWYQVLIRMLIIKGA